MKRLIKKLLRIKTKKNGVYTATVSEHRIEPLIKLLVKDDKIKITGLAAFCQQDCKQCTFIITYEHYTY